jgi:hypothetical protein
MKTSELTPKEPKYAFYIETEDGQEVRWAPLSKTLALNMYNLTDKKQPMNVKTYGWGEVK